MPQTLASARTRSNVASAIVLGRNDHATNGYVLGDDGLVRWSDLHAEAWVGFLEAHKRLTRALDAELDGRHGVTLSAAEVLGRLAATEDRCMRLSKLATVTGLSLSRISRIVDALAARDLVIRKGREDDARAVEAHLTAAGLELARGAQASHFASVQACFFDQLSADELATLARVFARLGPPPVADA
jgi:DNA-binding MarR family transcriptional regulator